MNNRRKFLLNSSMASAALLVAKPFKTIAGTLSPVSGFSLNNNKIVLLHTGNYNPANQYVATQQISRIKKSTGNVVLLHAGEEKVQGCDSALKADNCASLSSNNYKVIFKDNIKIGIITAASSEKEIVSSTETLAVYLKEQKNCNLVICLSKLGYKNNDAADDIKLAESSTALDVIIGGHPVNFTKHALTAQNKNRQEVLIHSAADAGFALGNIEISFDDAGNKNAVALNNLLTRIAAHS